MKVYLVGGAVRDTLLGIPLKERDYVVVGSSSDEMLNLGFKKVGKDFPVFLHPQTQAEYALARQERKKSPGYYGFECISSPTITLEQDLLRRDLTINAMAMDESGKIIDPYNGMADLNHKILRHVSPAFAEDPLRVLRVARFYSRFKHLGFIIDPTTLSLMRKIVKSGELKYLAAERVWKELQLSFLTQDPDAFIIALRECGALGEIFPELNNLFGVPNSLSCCCAIDVGMHILRLVNITRKMSNDPLIIFSMLVRDLGKAKTPINLWPQHNDHELLGAELLENFYKRCKIPNTYLKIAKKIILLHKYIDLIDQLDAEKILFIFRSTNAFQDSSLFFEKLLLAAHVEQVAISNDPDYNNSKIQIWKMLLDKCRLINIKEIINLDSNVDSNKIPDIIKNKYIECINDLIKKQFNLA